MLRKQLFQLYQASFTLPEFKSIWGQWEFLRSERNAFELNFLQISALNISGTTYWDTNLSNCKNKIVIAYRQGVNTRAHNTLSVVRNKKVNESRWIACFMLVTLVGSVITCVNWYVSIILTRRIVCPLSLVEGYNWYHQLCKYQNNPFHPFSKEIQRFQNVYFFFFYVDWRVRRPVPTKYQKWFGVWFLDF